jgi:methionyl-tRNA formyltransferase
VEAIYLENNIPHLFIPGFNHPVTIDILSHGGVDAVLMAETSILKKPILSSIPGGFLNLHAAPLPEYRGSNTTYWALYHDEPLYVTAHIVDQGVDTGPILGKKRLPVFRGDTLINIAQRGYEICGELATILLSKALQSGIQCIPQKTWQGKTYKGILPPQILEECERRLREEEYTHYETKTE